MGEGLLVYHAAQLQKQGASIEEVAKWVEETANRLAHWFTVDDLNHLSAAGASRRRRVVRHHAGH